MISLLRNVIISFCKEFVEHPYLCYTEHGQHARFYNQVYQAIAQDARYLDWDGQRICIIQKEYPTSGKLGKPQRQHWDFAVLKSPAESIIQGPNAIDFLRLIAAVEFGLNEGKEHLIDDIERLCHPESNLEQGFIIHLYRLSKPGQHISGRDWSPNSKRILTTEDICKFSVDKPVEIYFAISDMTNTHPSGIWCIIDGEVDQIIQ